MGQYVPDGSFKLTSRNINSTLYASAQKRDQKWIPSELDITELSAACVGNFDGVLVNKSCNGSSDGYIPSGDFKETSENYGGVLILYTILD